MVPWGYTTMNILKIPAGVARRSFSTKSNEALEECAHVRVFPNIPDRSPEWNPYNPFVVPMYPGVLRRSILKGSPVNLVYPGLLFFWNPS